MPLCAHTASCYIHAEHYCSTTPAPLAVYFACATPYVFLHFLRYFVDIDFFDNLLGGFNHKVVVQGWCYNKHMPVCGVGERSVVKHSVCIRREHE